MPKISVLITTYNGERFVQDQMQSILDQSIRADEVKIFDDQSCDDGCTVRVVTEFIEKNKLPNWFLTINKENKGWKRNFIDGIKEMNGEYIFLSDQDDIWAPEKIKEMCEIMDSKHEIELLCSNYKVLNESGGRIPRKKLQKMRNNSKVEKVKLNERFHLVNRPGCTYCLRRDFALDIIQAWEDGYAHDKLFWVAAILRDSLYIYNKPLIEFRRHGSNASGKGPVMDKMLRASKQKADERVVRKLCCNIKQDSNFIKRYFNWSKQRVEQLQTGRVLDWLCESVYLPYYSSVSSYVGDLVVSRGKGKK